MLVIGVETKICRADVYIGPVITATSPLERLVKFACKDLEVIDENW